MKPSEIAYYGFGLSPFAATALALYFGLVKRAGKNAGLLGIPREHAIGDPPPAVFIPGRLPPLAHSILMDIVAAFFMILTLAAVLSLYTLFKPADGYSLFSYSAWWGGGYFMVVLARNTIVQWIMFHWLPPRCRLCGAAMVWEIRSIRNDAFRTDYACTYCPGRKEIG